jgi:hypothetical protein
MPAKLANVISMAADTHRQQWPDPVDGGTLIARRDFESTLICATITAGPDSTSTGH